MKNKYINNYTLSTIFLFQLFLSGCTTYPTTTEDQATYYVKEASEALAKNDGDGMAYNVQMALDRISGEVKVREMFSNQPKGRNLYFSFLEKSIYKISNGKEARLISRKINDASSVLTQDQISSLAVKLDTLVVEGNLNETIVFNLSDDITNFPILNTSSAKKKIVSRTIKQLQESGSKSRPIEGLMQYIQHVGKESEEGKKLGALLPTLNIRRDELDLVSRQFPEFAISRKKSLTANIFLKINNGDRLFSDDLLQAAKTKIRGVEWNKTGGAKTTSVVVERIRHDEKVLQDRTQTITYAQHEVDFVQAALFMPRNASYIYEVTTGGAEIEYGYVITALIDGKVIHEEVVRGKVGGESSRCQSARIQNVFGGVTSAGFVANNDMQNKCNGTTTGSIDVLRGEVFSKIIDGMLTVPQIKVANDIN